MNLVSMLLMLMAGAAASAPPPPAAALAIEDFTVTEGGPGTVAVATFRVSLSFAQQLPVTVQWATEDLTAQAGSDYQAAAGTLRFEAAGALEIRVNVQGDGDATEGSEAFLVRLSSPMNAVIAKAAGHGVIEDDDFVSPHAKCDLDHNGRSNLLVFHEHTPPDLRHNPLHQDWGITVTIPKVNLGSVEYPAESDVKWRPRAMDDFDGDGNCDLFWELDRTLAITRGGADGSLVAPLDEDVLRVAHPGPDWRLVGSGRFDDDGRADLLWWNASLRLLVVWSWSHDNLVAHALQVPFPGDGAPAEPLGVVDLTGTRTAGILWRDPSTAELSYWRVEGFVATASLAVARPADRETSLWRLAAVGDFNGDGTEDLLWQDPFARVTVWLMRGTAVMAQSPSSPDRLKIPHHADGIVLGPR